MRPLALTILALTACRGEPFQSSSGAGGSGAASGTGSGGEATGAGGTGGTGAVGLGGTGGTGGAPPTHQVVTVRYVSPFASLTGRVLVVHDAEGIPVEISATTQDGTVVTVPIGGFVTVLEDFFAGKDVFAAKVLEGVTAVTFLQGQAGVNPNPAANSAFMGQCLPQCLAGERVEVHRSCETPSSFVIFPNPVSIVTHLAATDGCQNSANIDVSIVTYSALGMPIRSGTATSTLPMVPAPIPLASLTAGQITELPLPVDGLLLGWEPNRRVLSRDPAGQTLRIFEPTVMGTPESVFLVSALATNLRVQRGASNDLPAAPLYIQRYDNHVLGTALPAFGLGSIAIPNPPELPLFTTPAQPLVSWSLGGGPLGQKIVLGLDDTNESLAQWEIHVPASPNGSVLLPKLPDGPEYEGFNLGVPDIGFYANVAVDDGDYASALSSGIGLASVPPDTPSFTWGATIGAIE